MPQKSPDSSSPPATDSARRKGRQASAPASGSGDAVKSAGKAGSASARIQVRASGVHGRGMYAVAALTAGERLIEYRGERIDWDEALRRHPHDPAQPDHTFFFHLEDGRVIDAAVGGNNARWINHACEPNCEAREADGRVFIHALTDISPGEELFYDYGLVIDERYTAKVKKRFECRCGSPRCRGTMLAPKR